MFLVGAGTYRTFWSLALPLSGPAVATVTILTFLAEWNSLPRHQCAGECLPRLHVRRL